MVAMAQEDEVEEDSVLDEGDDEAEEEDDEEASVDDGDGQQVESVGGTEEEEEGETDENAPKGSPDADTVILFTRPANLGQGKNKIIFIKVYNYLIKIS